MLYTNDLCTHNDFDPIIPGDAFTKAPSDGAAGVAWSDADVQFNPHTSPHPRDISNVDPISRIPSNSTDPVDLEKRDDKFGWVVSSSKKNCGPGGDMGEKIKIHKNASVKYTQKQGAMTHINFGSWKSGPDTAVFYADDHCDTPNYPAGATQGTCVDVPRSFSVSWPG